MGVGAQTEILHGILRQIAVCGHRPYGFRFLSSPANAKLSSYRGSCLESFTVSSDGHYVGQDGFIVPTDFNEFFDRDPLWVRRWLTKRMRGRIGRDAIRDLEQDLLLYLCSLPEKSKFREKGANGRVDGCTDVIECFDPVRHFGATAGRFHNFVNFCLANRLNTILSRLRQSPLQHPNNVSIDGSEPEPGRARESEEVSEEYLVNHSRALAAEKWRRQRPDEVLLRIYIGEFLSLVMEEAPELLAVIHAIQSTGTLKEAQTMAGIDAIRFRKHRARLCVLKDLFLAGQGNRNVGRHL